MNLKNIIREEMDDMEWMKDASNLPTSVMIDLQESTTSKQHILDAYHDEGHEWNGSQDLRTTHTPMRYLIIGPIYQESGGKFLDEKKVMHTNKYPDPVFEKEGIYVELITL